MEIYFQSVSNVVDEKKKPEKLPVIQGSMKRQGPQTWLKCDEEKDMVCEGCVRTNKHWSHRML